MQKSNIYIVIQSNVSKNIQKRVYNSKDVFDKSLRNQFSINGIVESFPGIFSISWTNFLEQHSDHIFWCKI